ncbi:Branched-chain-amino-acid aminotransferase, cytosolic [Lamellibrachia satsuma]|nr:Branched-chain-amino-acid aminotransferase, cytosolic [Lamellibrachia satsuma]
MLAVYRPQHPSFIPAFLDQFEELNARLDSAAGRVVITGDFNLRVDVGSVPDVSRSPQGLTDSTRSSPEFDAEEFQNCLLKLVGVDKQWVPPATVGSLLVRSAVISTDASLQVTVPRKALLYVITSQAETDFTPLSLLAEARYIRVLDGVWGCTKMGANYAPTITVQQEAAIEHGCHEVLWLHGPRRHLTHAGDMNIFMLWTSADGKKELLTPSTASGVILPGVTRDSLLRLARNWGEFEVTERMFTIDEVSQAVKQGRMQEMFGCCAEYGVRPITEIMYDGDRLTMPPMSTEASITSRLNVQLSDIQCGRIPSEWVTDVEGHL